ncbi:hypothetical protein BH23GEM8_BH23GEM8_04770 [soil metagenome]
MPSLKLFGGASVETPDGPLTGRAAQRHRIALLALLVTRRAIGREKLISYLWPDVSLERGRHLLSDSVYRLNRALGDETIIAAGDELRLDPRRLPSDVSEFLQACDEGRPIDAVDLYGGPFLDGFYLDCAAEFERWLEQERERLSRMYAAALETLAEESAEAGDRKTESGWWYRLAAHDPLSPRVALKLMEALDAHGERGAALRHGRIYRTLFEDEFQTEVDPRISAFSKRVAEEGESSAGVNRSTHSVEGASVSQPGTRIAASPEADESIRAPEPIDSGVQPRPQEGRRPLAEALRSRRFSTLLLLPVLLTLTIVWYTTGRSAAPEPVPTVAVLPFADLSPSGDHAYFASGVMEEVAGILSRVPGMRVFAHAGASGGELDVQRVGQTLGVQSVVQGSVSRWGDSLRIHAKLIRVADRSFLWSRTYTSRLESIFAIQDSIAEAIGSTLAPRLGIRPSAERGQSTPEELEAYNLYLKGRYAWHRRTRESLALAVTHFEAAAAVAPGYARAHAGLADALAVQGFYDHRPPTEAFPAAEASARRALALDPRLAQSQATLGYVNLYFHWRWDEAERAFERAIQLDPGYSTAHQWQANYLTAMGRFAEAEAAMRRAMELDPLSLIANAALGWVFLSAGEYERAIEQCERTLELDPDFHLALLWSGLAHDQLGRSGDAIRLLERARALSPGSAITIAALAQSHAAAGRPEEARTLLRELQHGEPRYIPSYEVAKVHLSLGDAEAALDWLEKAFRQRSHSMAFLAVDPHLAGLRTHPRFRDLMRRAGHGT